VLPVPIAGALTLGLALLAACADGTNPTAVSDRPLFARVSADNRDRCDPPEVQPVLEFEDEGTAEGVAVSRKGDVFVGNAISGKAEIWRAPEGDFDEAYLLADLPGGDLLGMDVDRVGNLYAAVAAFLDPALHGLWRVQTDGTARRVAALPSASLPNDVTIDSRGNVYVSDSFDGKIWRLTPDGEFTVWIQDDLLRGFFGEFEFGVNGLVYHKRALYAAITVSGRVIKVPIRPDGAAGTPAILVQDDALIGIDGIEPDVEGNLYVTNNFASTIQVIRADDLEIEVDDLGIEADDLRIETITGEGLSAPASLAFNKNQRVLYVANLSTSSGFPQPHAPALVQAKFSAPVLACASFD
jgi:hypothetical protein